MDVTWWFVIAVAGAIGAAVIAGAKGRSAFGYFLLGLLFWPLAILVAIGMPTRRAIAVATPVPAARPALAAQPSEGRRQCPVCAEWIMLGAIKCRFCGADVAGQPADPANAARRRLEAQGFTISATGDGHRIVAPGGMSYFARDSKRLDDLLLKLDAARAPP